MKGSRAMSTLTSFIFYTIVFVILLLLVLMFTFAMSPAETPRLSCALYFKIADLVDNSPIEFMIADATWSLRGLVCKPRLINYGKPGTEWYESIRFCEDIKSHLTDEGWKHFSKDLHYLPDSCNNLQEFLKDQKNRKKYFNFLANYLVAKNIIIAYKELGGEGGDTLGHDTLLRVVCISYPGEELVNASKNNELYIVINSSRENYRVDTSIAVNNIISYFKSNPFKDRHDTYLWATMRDWDYTKKGDYVFRWCPVHINYDDGDVKVSFSCGDSNDPNPSPQERYARWLANNIAKYAVCVFIGVDDKDEGNDNNNHVIVTKGYLFGEPEFFLYNSDPARAIEDYYRNLDWGTLRERYIARVNNYYYWRGFFFDDAHVESIHDFSYKVGSDLKNPKHYLNAYGPSRYGIIFYYTKLLKKLRFLDVIAARNSPESNILCSLNISVDVNSTGLLENETSACGQDYHVIINRGYPVVIYIDSTQYSFNCDSCSGPGTCGIPTCDEMKSRIYPLISGAYIRYDFVANTSELQKWFYNYSGPWTIVEIKEGYNTYLIAEYGKSVWRYILNDALTFVYEIIEAAKNDKTYNNLLFSIENFKDKVVYTKLEGAEYKQKEDYLINAVKDGMYKYTHIYGTKVKWTYSSWNDDWNRQCDSYYILGNGVVGCDRCPDKTISLFLNPDRSKESNIIIAT